MLYPTPAPGVDEYPASYADRLARWYARFVPAIHKKQLGQYLTPIQVARFMAESFHLEGANCLRVLDPGAGTGILACAFCERLARMASRPTHVELVAYEIDCQLANMLEASLRHATGWLGQRGIALNASVRREDFILAHALALDESQLCLWTDECATDDFDIAIGNPPYFKLSKCDPRAEAARAVVHGQPNIYALFMAITASILRSGGEMVFITPRSYATGPYFRLFREAFFERMKPLAIHVFDSRSDAFRRDEVLQENVILTARRVDAWWASGRLDPVTISSCHGLHDITRVRTRTLPLVDVLDAGTTDRVLRIPVTENDTAAACVVDGWPGTLRSYGLEVSTGPVVPFRATDLLERKGDGEAAQAPLLWMQSVLPMQVKWPAATRNKAQHMRISQDSMPLLLPDGNYVLMRRFSSKEQPRRLTAAPLLAGALHSRYIGLENHLNYIYRPGGSLSADEAYGLAALFNTTLLDTYFRLSNGHTQVNATELRAMPLPPIDLIREIGKRAMSASNSVADVDHIVESVLRYHRTYQTEGALADVKG